MSISGRPIRRVVTGINEDGKSCVLHDSAAPNTNVRPNGARFVELWTFDECPVPLSGTEDGSARPLSHSPPPRGAHFRIVDILPDSQARIDQKQAAANFTAMNANGLSQHVESSRHWNMHRTPTVDYGVILEGEFIQVLPEGEFRMKAGDVVVQLGHAHSWSNPTNQVGTIAFVMIGGEFSS